jgi:hypothetical protein
MFCPYRWAPHGLKNPRQPLPLNARLGTRPAAARQDHAPSLREAASAGPPRESGRAPEMPSPREPKLTGTWAPATGSLLPLWPAHDLSDEEQTTCINRCTTVLLFDSGAPRSILRHPGLWIYPRSAASPGGRGSCSPHRSRSDGPALGHRAVSWTNTAHHAPVCHHASRSTSLSSHPGFIW